MAIMCALNMLLLALLHLGLTVALNGVNTWTKPWFCHDLDCPRFNITKNITIAGQTISIRAYESAMWSSTLIKNTDLEKAEQTGFQRNFDYIDGGNTASSSIPMTSPVLNYVEPAQGPYCTTNFTISFYVPYSYQPPNSGPPKPTDSEVYLQTLNAMNVAVLEFQGFAEEKVVIAKAAELSQLLKSSDLSYDNSNWFFAGYDPPFRVAGRHNEVWIQVYN